MKIFKSKDQAAKILGEKNCGSENGGDTRNSGEKLGVASQVGRLITGVKQRMRRMTGHMAWTYSTDDLCQLAPLGVVTNVSTQWLQ